MKEKFCVQKLLGFLGKPSDIIQPIQNSFQNNHRLGYSETSNVPSEKEDGSLKRKAWLQGCTAFFDAYVKCLHS